MKSELELIYQEVKHRGITRLCHFTQARKLVHILADIEGLASTKWLEANHPDLLNQTDPQRLDSHPDHISCSIQYPNSWYLKKAKGRESLFKDWTVILINPDVLWREGNLFCYTNGATQHGNLLQPGFEAFKKMFALTVGTGSRAFSRTTVYPLSCPTNGQAEVMIYQFIELDMFSGVAFETDEQACKTIGRLEDVGIPKRILESITWIIAPSLFQPNWKYSVDKGILPPEKIYRESSS